MRVLLPMFEKQSLQQGIEIDRLEPPIDPFRPRVNKKTQSIWQKTPLNTPLYAPSNGENTLSNETTGKWDTPGFRTEEPVVEDSREAPKSSSWKFF